MSALTPEQSVLVFMLSVFKKKRINHKLNLMCFYVICCVV